MNKDKDNNPYNDIEYTNNVVQRTFSKNISEKELTWHRDHEDRDILVINENDWYIQIDNELPQKLTINEQYFIPKNIYHRVIKGTTDLVVNITKKY